jgi:hypothetical protein
MLNVQKFKITKLFSQGNFSKLIAFCQKQQKIGEKCHLFYENLI